LEPYGGDHERKEGGDTSFRVNLKRGEVLKKEVFLTSKKNQFHLYVGEEAVFFGGKKRARGKKENTEKSFYKAEKEGKVPAGCHKQIFQRMGGEKRELTGPVDGKNCRKEHAGGFLWIR